MSNYANITFTTNKQRVDETINQFYGLTFFEAIWGNINWVDTVTSVEELQKKYGLYDSNINKNDWFQAYNFLSYTPRLKIYRVGWRENIPTFTGTTLTNMFGSNNAHLFINAKSESSKTPSWDSTNNGSNVYYKLSDYESYNNYPSFASNELLFIAAKYCGTRGNDVGISIANSSTDLTTTYVFKHTELVVVSVAGYSVGDYITGDTSDARGFVRSIDSTSLWVEVTQGTFQASETIDSGTTTISSLNSSDDVELNYTMSEVFKREISVNEIGIIITLDNEVIESGIYSLSNNKDNYIEIISSEYVNIYLTDGYVDPESTDNVTIQNNNIPHQIINEKLLFGSNTQTATTEIASQLSSLSDVYFADFDVLFTDTIDQDIYDSLVEINNTRDDFLLIFNRIDSLAEITYLVDEEGDYIISEDGDLIIE